MRLVAFALVVWIRFVRDSPNSSALRSCSRCVWFFAFVWLRCILSVGSCFTLPCCAFAFVSLVACVRFRLNVTFLSRSRFVSVALFVPVYPGCCVSCSTLHPVGLRCCVVGTCVVTFVVAFAASFLILPLRSVSHTFYV